MNPLEANLAAIAAPPLPIYLSGPGALLWIVVAILAAIRLRDRVAGFLVLALLLRYLLAAFYTFSFSPSPAGLSWNALGSLAVMAVGLLLIDRRFLGFKFLIPLYALMAIATASAIANGDASGYISAITKYGYLLVIIVLSYDALRRVGDRLMPALLVVFSGPVLFQIFSIAAHVSKAAEADGSTSYVGGFAHEAPFSIILGTGIFVAATARRLRPHYTSALTLLFIIGIFFANYRTTILALGPLVLIQLFASGVGAIAPRQRALAAAVAAGVSIAAVGAIAVDGAARFSDLANVVRLPELLTKPTAEMTRAERRVFSNRAQLWNININAWRDGTPRNWLLGAGPEVRAPGALLYPHNTLVAALYETGALGAIALVVLWLAMLRVAWRVRAPDRATLVAAHVGFFILNMATMPFWYIEGMLFYGLLCGYSFYRYRLSRSHSIARAAAMQGALPLVARA